MTTLLIILLCIFLWFALRAIERQLAQVAAEMHSLSEELALPSVPDGQPVPPLRRIK